MVIDTETKFDNTTTFLPIPYGNQDLPYEDALGNVQICEDNHQELAVRIFQKVLRELQFVHFQDDNGVETTVPTCNLCNGHPVKNCGDICNYCYVEVVAPFESECKYCSILIARNRHVCLSCKSKKTNGWKPCHGCEMTLTSRKKEMCSPCQSELRWRRGSCKCGVTLGEGRTICCKCSPQVKPFSVKEEKKEDCKGKEEYTEEYSHSLNQPETIEDVLKMIGDIGFSKPILAN